MSNMQVETWIKFGLLVLSSLLVVVFLPTAIGFWIKFFKLLQSLQHTTNDTKAFIKVRYPVLVDLINVTCCLIMIIDIPYILVVNIFGLIKFSSSNFVYSLINSVFSYLLLILLFIKFYLLHYNTKLSVAKMNEAWQTAINQNVRNWYIVNATHFGNSIWILKRVLIFLYFPIILCIILNELFIGKLILNVYSIHLRTPCWHRYQY